MAVQTTRIRSRAKNLSVAKGLVLPMMQNLVEFSFVEGLASQFAHILKVDKETSKSASVDLSELARSYLTGKETKISSREVVRSDLLKVERVGSVDELKELLQIVDQGTEHHLWARLKSAPDWPVGENAFHWLRAKPDLALVRKAAAAAAKAAKGGDYANTNLHFVISALVDIFEAYSSEKPVVGRPESRAALPSIVRLFFEQVDAQLAWSTIWNALDQEVRARRELSAS